MREIGDIESILVANDVGSNVIRMRVDGRRPVALRFFFSMLSTITIVERAAASSLG